MRLKYFLYNTLLFLLSITILNSCSQKQEEVPLESEIATDMVSVVQLTDAQLKNAQLQMLIPEKVNIAHVIKLNGKIEVMPENTITVSSPMSGFVRQIRWIPGMNVSKGQALIRLEEKEYIQLQQDYLSAQNALTYAKLDFDRQSELSKNQATSEKILQMADEKVKQNQILLKSLGEKLKLIHINPATLTSANMTSQIVISAPASGTVTEVLVNSGMYVQAGDAMIKIIDDHGSKLVLKVFEKDLPFIRVGQKIIAYSNTQSDKKMNGKIEYIVNQVGEQGYANVICSMDGRSSEIKQGMYMNAEVEAQSIESWTLPDEAVVNFEGKEYIFLDKGGQSFEMMEVSLGQKENGKVQIINYQTIIDKMVVVKGAYTLLMKMKNVAE